MQDWPIDCYPRKQRFDLPGVIEFHKRERWSFAIFQVHERHLAKLVEKVLNILGPYVWGQISNVDAALVLAHGGKEAVV